MTGQLETINKTVAEHYGVSLRDFYSRRRARRITRPRQIAMYLAKQLTIRSLPEIANQLNMDHTTVLHAVRTIEGLMEKDPDLSRDVKALSLILADQIDPISDSLEAIAYRDLRSRITQLAARLMAVAKRDPMGLVARLEDVMDSLEHKPNGKGPVCGDSPGPQSKQSTGDIL